MTEILHNEFSGLRALDGLLVDLTGKRSAKKLHHEELKVFHDIFFYLVPSKSLQGSK